MRHQRHTPTIVQVVEQIAPMSQPHAQPHHQFSKPHDDTVRHLQRALARLRLPALLWPKLRRRRHHRLVLGGVALLQHRCRSPLDEPIEHVDLDARRVCQRLGRLDRPPQRRREDVIERHALERLGQLARLPLPARRQAAAHRRLVALVRIARDLTMPNQIQFHGLMHPDRRRRVATPKVWGQATSRTVCAITLRSIGPPSRAGTRRVATPRPALRLD